MYRSASSPDIRSLTIANVTFSSHETFLTKSTVNNRRHDVDFKGEILLTYQTYIYRCTFLSWFKGSFKCDSSVLHNMLILDPSFTIFHKFTHIF